MKEAKLLKLSANGSFETKHGTFYAWEACVKEENGETLCGSVNTKSVEPPYKVDDTIWFEKTGESPYGEPKLKISKNPPQQGFQNQAPARSNDARQESIVTQFAIREALVFLQWTCQNPADMNMRDVAVHARHFKAMVDDIDKYIEVSKATPIDPSNLPF